MSNEAKTKVDMDPKYLIKLTVTLFVTCVIVAGLLGFVNKLTLPNITAANERKTAAAIQEVLPEMEGSPTVVEPTDEMTAAASGAGATLTEANARVRQGYIEASNVNVVTEMVNMITITRAYESNQKVIQTIDGMLDKAVNNVGRV